MSWITVGFVPTPVALFAHSVIPFKNTTKVTRVAGWLIQHLYQEGQPIESRVVAGYIKGGELLPMSSIELVVGIYLSGEQPEPDDIATAKTIMNIP